LLNREARDSKTFRPGCWPLFVSVFAFRFQRTVRIYSQDRIQHMLHLSLGRIQTLCRSDLRTCNHLRAGQKIRVYSYFNQIVKPRS
jgi:hypothetical protein